ncbi:MAG: HAD family hydrolase [Actinobacteria bacterium]|nr:MAG: HAD family hydrolase [Actinomycetota bacterium]
MQRGAAFFDLDRTLMAGSSGMHFARAAYGSGMVGRRQLMRWGVEHVHFRLRGSTDEQTSQLLSQVNVPARDIQRLAPGLLAGVLPRIYPQMLDEVRSHQDADRPTFIVSAAGNDLVEMLARVLGMEGGIGTQYEVDGDGLLTGRIVEPFVYGEGKVAKMRDFAEEHDIDLAASWAYSDSVSDLPMLRAVGHPVAVNPDTELAEIAVEEGWRVMRFERLGRQLAIAGATLVAAAVGGTGTVLARRRPERRGYRATLRR